MIRHYLQFSDLDASEYAYLFERAALIKRRFKAYVIGVAVLLTLLVGLTRVYLAAHWATDVLAGWSVGAAWAMALWLIAYGLQRRQTARPQAPHVLPVDEG